jgi:peptidyl-prolyl cis-trans isomerase B (cyclophilin B)
MLTRPAIASLFLLPGLAALAACGSETEPEAAGPSETEATCTYDTDPMGGAREVEKPQGEPTETGPVDAVIKTNVGDIKLELDGASAPCTVNSFVSLAEQGFYDDTPCPRLAASPTFGILQCGDPTGTGSGGPGYSFADELSGDETYEAGTLAMANGGPDTNGSQFFLVFNDSGLTPDYTVFGHVDADGIALLKSVGAKGDDGSHPAGGGKPNQPVDITDVVVG